MKLLEKSNQELNKLFEILSENKKMEIEIDGHTDDVGSAEFNLELSKKRAYAVMEYLIKKGTDKKRLSYKGFGSSMPLSKNNTDEDRQKNRRVEFTILKK